MSGALPKGWEAVERALGGAEPELEALRGLLDKAGAADPERFAEMVDGSGHSVRDWAEALAVFDRWLDEQGIAARPFDAMCGYLHCCGMLNPATLPSPSLKVTLVEALTEFGFDASVDGQN